MYKIEHILFLSTTTFNYVLYSQYTWGTLARWDTFWETLDFAGAMFSIHNSSGAQHLVAVHTATDPKDFLEIFGAW